jgi:tripartite-type tricarboxylate transporter receptor subunit TctC
MTRLIHFIALLVAFATVSQIVAAADFPAKPIRFIVPYPPGGGNDLFARLMGQKISENTGQPVVVDNRPGAGGLVAGDLLARSAPDGYTIMVDQSSIATNPLLYKKTPFDVTKDLAPVIWGISLDNVLLVAPSLPVKDLGELIEYAKKNPGKLNYASAGLGSSQHLATEIFMKAAGIDMVHVPYKGGGPALTSVSVGETQVFMISVSTALSFVKTGKVKALAVGGKSRSNLLPEVPTFAEAGLPSYASSGWLGIFTTAGTPRSVVDRLNAEFVKALAAPDVKEKLSRQGFEVVASRPEELGKLIRDEMMRYRKVIEDKRITLD